MIQTISKLLLLSFLGLLPFCNSPEKVSTVDKIEMLASAPIEPNEVLYRDSFSILGVQYSVEFMIPQYIKLDQCLMDCDRGYCFTGMQDTIRYMFYYSQYKRTFDSEFLKNTCVNGELKMSKDFLCNKINSTFSNKTKKWFLIKGTTLDTFEYSNLGILTAFTTDDIEINCTIMRNRKISFNNSFSLEKNIEYLKITRN